MTMTMDDDGAILVHLTNPGGIVGGSGVANQITYWTDTDTIGGDAGLTYDAVTNSLTIAGDIDLAGHLAVGNDAIVSPNIAARIVEIYTNVAGHRYGTQFWADGQPAVNGAGSYVGFYGGGKLSTNFNASLAVGIHAEAIQEGTATLAQCWALYANAYISPGVVGTATNLRGGYFRTDVEDGSCTNAFTIILETPYVDTGTLGTGYGIRMYQGVNNNVLTTLYGIYMSAITAGSTNYAIYSAGGNSHHTGKVSIGGTVVPLAQLHVDQSSGSGTVPVLYLDQGDVSEPFTNYVGTSAASAANSLSSWTTGNAAQGHIQIDVNGTKRWLRFYNDPTS